MNPCIIYLAQNTQKDPHYKRDSRSMLEKSLDLLYKNYNDQFRHPIIIFHEGDFLKKDQEEVKKGRIEIQFQEVHFEIPNFLNPSEVPEMWDGHVNLGTRHMCRFYSLQIFDIIRDLGYDWFFRMDDDSFIHSKISYNLFEYMEKNDFEYGYRVDTKDPQRVCYGFSETVVAYLKAERIKPQTFFDHFAKPEDINNEYFSFKGKVKTVIGSFIDKIATKINYDLNGWIPPTEWDRWGYYNNFFITKTSFWHQPEVQSFLHHLDRVGAGYKYRWSDLIVQTVAVQIFLPESKVYKFTDWTYEHATIVDGKLDWGGIYLGDDDPESEELKNFEKAYGKAKIECSY